MMMMGEKAILHLLLLLGGIAPLFFAMSQVGF